MINFERWVKKIMGRKDTGVARITYNEKVGSQTEEIRLKEFDKSFSFDATIFRCTVCLTPRKYGQHGSPERTIALILCEGTCRKHTWHSYISIGRRRGDDTNYAGISDNS